MQLLSLISAVGYRHAVQQTSLRHFILPKNKNIIFNNTTEIQLAGRQNNIKFMKLAPICYTQILQNDKHTLQQQQKVKYLFSLAADNNKTLSRKIYKQ